jgi:LacI family transcriptional regulator, repressor for deo operon, udp, cdd, tsx, nupC, and nupG
MARVRLKDIAQRAGVSVMTVSKVLRNEPDVSAATKNRVGALAQEMGYVPDVMAQSLRTRSTRLIGLIIPAITNPIFARLLLAVEDRVQQAGCDLVFGHTLNRPEREEHLIRRMLSRRVNGLLLFPVHRLESRSPAYEELRRHGLPTVILGPLTLACADFPNVQVDDIQASYGATQHLLDLGHRRIAYFVGPPAAIWAQERFQGYQRALRDAGLGVEDDLVFQAGGTIEEGARAALQLLQERVDATAVQAVNDLVAIGAANQLLDQRLRIPDDLSVVGFGNVLTASFFRVPLTTVRQPKHSMGLAAMDMLEALIRGERPESRRLPASLLVRSSTAPPPPEGRLTAQTDLPTAP